MQLAFMSEALAQEATAANDAKSEAQFTVIVGNPPYSNFGKSNDNPWISRLLAGFRGDMRGEVKVNLYDDYIKFFAMANNAVERAGAGVIGFITNRSYLDGSTQREMRHAMLDGASISVLDLYRGIYDPEARRDENVFDITTGVAISLIWKPVSDRQVLFSRVVGKYSEKVEILSKEAINISGHKAISPSSPQFLLIDAPAENEAYESWIALPDLFVESTTGVQTNRDELCPRIPKPKSRELFRRLISLGARLVALHMLDANALPDLFVSPKVRFVSNGGEPRLGRINKEVRRDASARPTTRSSNAIVSS